MVLGERQTDLRREIDLAGTTQPGASLSPYFDVLRVAIRVETYGACTRRSCPSSLLVADEVSTPFVRAEPQVGGTSPGKFAHQCLTSQVSALKFDVITAALSDQAGSIEFENATADASCNRIADGFTTSKATISVPRTTFDQMNDHAASVGSRAGEGCVPHSVRK
jgi:hypothetical protein